MKVSPITPSLKLSTPGAIMTRQNKQLRRNKSASSKIQIQMLPTKLLPEVLRNYLPKPNQNKAVTKSVAGLVIS